MSQQELGEILGSFYESARTKDGQLYSKSSILCIRAAIQRYLQSPPYNRHIDIISGACFAQANAAIKESIQMMRKNGMDKASRHQPIAPEDLKRLYTSGVFAADTPTTLQNKVYFDISLHIGKTGRDTLRKLKKSIIIFEKDHQGNQFATLSCQAQERNQQGANIHQEEDIQKIYATGKPSCPVASLKSYIGHLNPDCEAFFQRPKTSNFLGKVIWYLASPMGVNTISTFMKRISVAANLSHRYTNDCVRASVGNTLSPTPNE